MPANRPELPTRPADESSELTETMLLAAAAQQGTMVTPTQLKRLRMAGLVARPIQQHRIGVHGSVAVYPPEAVKQLWELEPLRGERRLDHLTMLAWWNGLDVAPADARRAAIRLL